MKFMSAFINHSLLPARRGDTFQGVPEVTSTSVPFNQSDDIANNRESVVQNFSFKGSTDPAKNAPQTITPNTSSEESDVLSTQVKDYHSDEVETQHLKGPLSKSEFSISGGSQSFEPYKVNSKLDFNSSELINQTEGESLLEIRKTKLQKKELHSNELQNNEQLNNVQININTMGAKPLSEEQDNTFDEIFNKQDNEQNSSEKIGLSKNISPPKIQLEPPETGRKESRKKTENKFETSNETQSFNHSIQAEPVLIPPLKKVENTHSQQPESTISQSQSASLFKGQAVAEEIPQVRIGQVNVVIDDRSSKPRNNTVTSTRKTVNAFGLRGL